ncbi:hypothetical protein LguiA_024257 [Lonicera macranthoides]
MGDMQIVAAVKKVEAQFVEMSVPLYSYGCEKKIKKALAHFKGIYSVNVDFYQQKVIVWGICNKYDVLTTIRNKRKEARFWNSQDNDIDDNNIVGLEEERKTSSSFCKKHSAQPLALIMARSLSWKSWKKAFLRSYSF